MPKETKQLSRWKSDFGRKYTDRSDIPLSQAEERNRRFIGRTMRESFRVMLTGLDITSVLEVGCNVGHKLEILSSLGDYRLYGLEPSKYALQKGRNRLLEVNFVEGDVFDIPLKDDFFDLVFTSGVLIHISPEDLPEGLSEIYRVSKRYILGFEYHSEKIEMVNYRGDDDLLWKMDYEQMYLKQFPTLKVLRSEILEYDESVYNRRGLFEKHFLLSK